MPQKVRTAFTAVVASIVFLAVIFHRHLFRDKPLISVEDLLAPSLPLYPQTNANHAIRQEEEVTHQSSRHVSFVPDSISTVSILFPAWEVFVIVSPETPLPPDFVTAHFTCLFPNNDSSPAIPARIWPFPYRTTFKCDFPARLRRRLPFPQPILTRWPVNPPGRQFPAPELLWWNFIVYDSFATEYDVILFVKGLNNRQGVNRKPNELRCVFGDDVVNGVKTAVTTSLQEVFRCQQPELTAVSSSGGDEGERIKISLEFSEQKMVVPSVTYYTPSRKIALQKPKSLLCACTMVHNVAKFLKEWVVYHSGIGVGRFILYDNESDDDLDRVVEELVREGYNVSTLFWFWPKAQEAGFSHCAMYAKDSCAWMMFIDVDEFVYSPSWLNSPKPSDQMLKSLLPLKPSRSLSSSLMVEEPSTTSPLLSKKVGKVGQVMISCYEFGPSNQQTHPVTGVTQGYNCRRLAENRHKSIVLLDAIDESLLNVIHHFQLKQGYMARKLSMEDAVVNHYKFQAWSEFKTKFRRRVSAYVVDWMQAVNPESKDRTPGLGYVPVEPDGWPEKFCDVYDNQLKDLTQRWFGIQSPFGYHMAWQR